MAVEEAQYEAQSDPLIDVVNQHHADACKYNSSGENLCQTSAQNERSHAPQKAGLEFKPDQEQQHHNAKFCEMQHLGLVAYCPDTKGSDQNTRNQIAENRAKAKALGDGHRCHSCYQIDEGSGQKITVFHMVPDVVCFHQIGGHGCCYTTR